MRDHHGRQRFEQIGHDIAATVGGQPVQPVPDEPAHHRLHLVDLAGGEAPGDQFAELGVLGRVLHHHRRVSGEPDLFELTVFHRQPCPRGEGAGVAGGGVHVLVPSEHPVGVAGVVGGNDAVHRVVVAQRGVHGPRFPPGLTGAQLESSPIPIQIYRHVASIRQIAIFVFTMRFWHPSPAQASFLRGDMQDADSLADTAHLHTDRIRPHASGDIGRPGGPCGLPHPAATHSSGSAARRSSCSTANGVTEPARPVASGNLVGSVLVSVLRSILLFAVAALAEIGGAWLVWQGVREHRGWAWIGAGVLALGLYGFVATLQPDADFGRILAAYGGVFVAGSLLWAMALDGFRPDRWDVIGALFCLTGVAIIMYAPRGAAAG